MNKVKLSDKKIVVIGGGTGLSILLRGLKKYLYNITAIVTVADDGGGSGVLREDLGMLPPGDVRSCLLALANTEPAMEKLLQFRFSEGNLKGQSLGNLFIAAMDSIYGSFERAIKEISNVLSITGQVLPMTLESVQLCAELENGAIIKGESIIPRESRKNGSKIKSMFINPSISYPLNDTLKAIDDADIIVLGPGSLYTSVIPNLLVNDMVQKIYNAKAPKVYICNVMTQPGETDGFGVLDHVQGIIDHSRENFLDYVIVNTEVIANDVLDKYNMDNASQVLPKSEDEDILQQMGIKLIKDNLIDIKHEYIRHDNMHLSKIILDIANGKYISGIITNE